MLNIRCCLLALLGIPLLLRGSSKDLSIRIISYPKEVPLGAPIYVEFEIKNVSGHPVTIFHGSHGYYPRWYVKRSDGTPRLRMNKKAGMKEDCDIDIINSEDNGYPGALEEFPADWRERFMPELSCDARPGELIVYFEVRSKGPYGDKDQYGKKCDEEKIWTGDLKTEEIKIKIVDPEGSDKAAYEEFKHQPYDHGDDILKKYPHSTYAAYRLWGGGSSWNSSYDGSYYSNLSHPHTPEDDYQQGQTLGRRNSDCPKCLESALRQLHTYIDPMEQLIRDFPDFPFRKQALYGLARSYFLVGTPEKAAPLLRELMSKFPDSEEAKSAVGYDQQLKLHHIAETNSEAPKQHSALTSSCNGCDDAAGQTAGIQPLPTGCLAGKVMDQKGTYLPGVKLKLKGNQWKGVVASDGRGCYVFPSLPPGTYELTLSMRRMFKPFKVQTEIHADTSTRLNLKMPYHTDTLRVIRS